MSRGLGGIQQRLLQILQKEEKLPSSLSYIPPGLFSTHELAGIAYNLPEDSSFSSLTEAQLSATRRALIRLAEAGFACCLIGEFGQYWGTPRVCSAVHDRVKRNGFRIRFRHGARNAHTYFRENDHEPPPWSHRR